jgi:hypothetical protein
LAHFPTAPARRAAILKELSFFAGKTIGIPQGPLQKYNEQTLDFDLELLQYSGEFGQTGFPPARRTRGGGS